MRRTTPEGEPIGRVMDRSELDESTLQQLGSVSYLLDARAVNATRAEHVLRANKEVLRSVIEGNNTHRDCE